MDGVVTKVWWANPHIRYDVDVTLPDGTVEGVDDSFAWGRDTGSVWRVRLSSASVERIPAVLSQCIGISASGLLCFEETPESLLPEGWMPGRLFLWPADGVDPR